MQQFQYKYLNIDVTVRTGQELFEAFWGPKKVQINGHQLVGFGITIPPNMSKLDPIKAPTQILKGHTDISKIKSLYGVQLVVAYKQGEQIKAKYIPLNGEDPQCQAMINQVAQDHPNTFLGLGPHFLITKALGVSMLKEIIIAVTIGLALGGLFIAYKMRHLLFNS